MSYHVTPNLICMNLWNYYLRYLWGHFLGLIYSAYLLSFLHIALVSFTSVSFSQWFSHVTSPHSSWDRLLRIQAFAVPHLLVISHRSFILFHASGTSVHWYLLTINKTRGRYALSLSSIFILHPFLPTHLLHAVPVANPWEILHAANFAICLFLFPSPLSRYLLDPIFLQVLVIFLLWHLIWFLLCLNNLYSHEASSHSSSHLSTIALFIYILWSRRLELLFSLSWILLASYYSARLFFFESLYTEVPPQHLRRAFSVFFQFAWNRFLSRPRSALPRVLLFSAAFLRSARFIRRVGIVVRFNFLRTLLLFVFTRFTQTASCPQALHFYAPHFWKFLRFVLSWLIILSSFFPLRLLLVTFYLLSPITLVLIHLSQVFFFFFIGVLFSPHFSPFFLSFVFLWVPTSRFCIYSFLLPLCAALSLPIYIFLYF